MNTVLNIAAYKFVGLDDAAKIRAPLLDFALAYSLKGTILLSPEGINMFLAGSEEGVQAFLATLRQDARFADIPVKESWSETVPFKKMRVRLKREIIRMNHPTIRPENGRAQAIDPATLKRWFDAGHDDEGRPLLLLDTRNDFEVEEGHFQGALNLHIQKFTDFPEAVAKVQDQLKDHAVVSYCTGGIRCEKATLYMNGLGLQHHWQLDGGILKYFEEVGGSYYEGRCTVFDERGALDTQLIPGPRTTSA